MLLTPSSAAPGSVVAVTGRGRRKTSTVLKIGGVSTSQIFRTNGGGQYSTTITVPAGAVDGPLKIAAEQPRATDGVWSQIDSATLTVKVPVVEPEPTPEPEPEPTPDTDPDPMVTSGPTAIEITQTSLKVTWSLSEVATGQVEFGLTAAYGQRTAKEMSFSYSTHIQPLSGLSPATEYHCRVVGEDQAGQTYASADRIVKTAGVVVEPEPEPEPTPTPDPEPVTSGIYGPGIAIDALSNTHVGGPFGLVNYYRFRAGASALLNSIRFYIIANGNTGYSNGTGGKIKITVRTDDGTANHFPTSTVLATAAIFAPGNGSGISGMFNATFASPAALVKGTLYHLHFENVDPSPTVNYLSLDGICTQNRLTPRRQPKYDNVDFGQGYFHGGAWLERPETIPVLQLNYSNGFIEGQSYLEVSYGATGGKITGIQMVRERITVTGGDKRVRSVSVRPWRVRGSDPLTVRVETAAGALVVEGTIPASAIPIPGTPPPLGPATWATLVFPASRALTNGATYHVRLSCPATSEYALLPIRNGSVTNGFNPVTAFADGRAQKTADGAAWSSLGNFPNENSLPFYFEKGA